MATAPQQISAGQPAVLPQQQATAPPAYNSLQEDLMKQQPPAAQQVLPTQQQGVPPQVWRPQGQVGYQLPPVIGAPQQGPVQYIMVRDSSKNVNTVLIRVQERCRKLLKVCHDNRHIHDKVMTL